MAGRTSRGWHHLKGRTTVSTTNDKPTKPPLYLAISETRDNGYFHLHARVCTDKHEYGQRAPYGVDDDYSDGLLYSYLRVSCQGDERSQRHADTRQAVYGWDHPEYRDHYKGDLRTLKRMVKTLEHLERKLGKLSETRGYARSYGEYLGRVAEALGCAGMAFQNSPKRASSCGLAYRWTSIGDGVNEANNAVWQWQREAIDRDAEVSA